RGLLAPGDSRRPRALHVLAEDFGGALGVVDVRRRRLLLVGLLGGVAGGHVEYGRAFRNLVGGHWPARRRAVVGPQQHGGDLVGVGLIGGFLGDRLLFLRRFLARGRRRRGEGRRLHLVARRGNRAVDLENELQRTGADLVAVLGLDLSTHRNFVDEGA